MLLERQSFLDELARRCSLAGDGAGQAVFVCGEAGVGKTALVSAFLENVPPDTMIVRGYCDPLTTPHALGPILEIWSQVSSSDPTQLQRDRLFSTLCAQLRQMPSLCVVLIEDLHWADEATLDFLRYASRRRVLSDESDSRCGRV